MAQMVLGVGSSHSPMVSLGGDDWLVWGEGDHRHPGIHRRDGQHLTYDQRLAEVGEGTAALATVERCRAGATRVEAAVVELRGAIDRADLDALIIVGDDQDEHLLSDNRPPFYVYYGETIVNEGLGDVDSLPPVRRAFLPGYREPDGARSYPVAVDLARRVIEVATDRGIDVATGDRLPVPDRGMGHAFGFPMRRLVEAGSELPIVPVMVNTYYPPSQPRAGRCLALGAAIRAAVDSLPGDRRVGIVASGGLSHFLVMEDLDREVLDALGRHDLDALCAWPESTWVSGTSEVKNWIAVGAACHDLDFEVVDYVPGYRTPAGSGTGLAFALWTGRAA
jgi:3-O-methylgallate 3,4-dioxygenase